MVKISNIYFSSSAMVFGFAREDKTSPPLNTIAIPYELLISLQDANLDEFIQKHETTIMGPRTLTVEQLTAIRDCMNNCNCSFGNSGH